MFSAFIRSERAGGILLVVCAIASLGMANSPLGAHWIGIWSAPLGPLTLREWVNDALMAVFFLLVGLELEREIYVGELSQLRGALLPIAAAAGGIVAPAAIHYVLNAGTPTQPGAGIPMATDIAFALAALSLLGARVPPSLKVFLTAFAVMDDLAAILVIALAYSADVSMGYLLAAGAVFALLVGANRLRVTSLAPYLAGGALLWIFMLRSGVHATVAGVLLAFAIPFTARAASQESPSLRLERLLHVPVALFVLPAFALANTAVVVGSAPLLGDSNSLGIVLGLALGKPLGIVAACWVAVRAGLRKPDDMRWVHVVGAGLLGGIGFTMSIFIANLAYPSDRALVDASKLAIMVASVASAIAGVAWLAIAGRRSRPAGPAA